MISPQKILIGSILGVILSASSGLAQSKPSVPVFSTPTFERQPLPRTSGTAGAWQTIAHNAFIAQDYVNSIAAFGKAIELAPAGDRPDLLAERGWVRYRLGQFERADADLQRAASLHLQQEQWRDYTNVNQMRRFVEAQADRLDSTS